SHFLALGAFGSFGALGGLGALGALGAFAGGGVTRSSRIANPTDTEKNGPTSWRYVGSDFGPAERYSRGFPTWTGTSRFTVRKSTSPGSFAVPPHTTTCWAPKPFARFR